MICSETPNLLMALGTGCLIETWDFGIFKILVLLQGFPDGVLGVMELSGWDVSCSVMALVPRDGISRLGIQFTSQSA